MAEWLSTSSTICLDDHETALWHSHGECLSVLLHAREREREKCIAYYFC